jgi:hypothetical protein
MPENCFDDNFIIPKFHSVPSSTILPKIFFRVDHPEEPTFKTLMFCLLLGSENPLHLNHVILLLIVYSFGGYFLEANNVIFKCMAHV